MRNRTLALAAIIVTLELPLHMAVSQDLFEFQVYDSDLVPKGKWEIDLHVSHIASGTKAADLTVLPTDGQTHFAIEITRGVIDEFEMGGYLLFARQADGKLRYAGVRLRPRFLAPESWEFPVGVSLSFEFGWPKLQYETDASTLEIRPIVDKTVGRWSFGLNPLITRSLRGPDAAGGLEFEPAAKISYDLAPNLLSVGLQYFGGMGPFRDFLPASEQTHFLHPNAELALSGNAVLNLGAAFALTNAAERLVLTARLGLVF